ncbi:ribonuclease P protein subunit p40 [Copidosoma floridanum]|uniref:ribonuclease P protein subunit p40 n=1 Tax=Copidosoma floridanum TaxID=29053 RepID=UPI0006C97356|nr:ribonuclease P protein subunit p40 [Copidosoma floridanum]XP_014204187.1 ribonuclease P protein subunit p40 [Copidosoma floridanum]
MLCPEVWNFKAPGHRIELHAGKDNVIIGNNLKVDDVTSDDVKDAIKRPSDTISSHYFNHSVSVTFPNTSNIPESFNQIILEDSDYYRVDGLSAVDLINKEFIEAFVKKGELNLLTIGRRVDVDDLVAVLPTGHLLLSLVRASYQSLGIEGKPSYFERREPSRYVVRIDLKDEKLTPGKKYYERIQNSLDRLHKLKFDVILAWDPPEERVCPSSVAAWLEKRSYAVSVCRQRANKRIQLTANYIPMLEDGCNYDEFFEWLGLFSIDGNLTNNGQEAEYVSSYQCPKPREVVGQISYLQCTGFFTRRKLLKIHELFREYASARGETLPWCSLDVQGFADSPVSWGMKEHSYYMDGDNSYTIVLNPAKGSYVLRRCTSSNRKPKIKQ